MCQGTHGPFCGGCPGWDGTAEPPGSWAGCSERSPARCGDAAPLAEALAAAEPPHCPRAAPRSSVCRVGKGKMRAGLQAHA